MKSILLYVSDPTVSARFYADLLGREPVEASPTFVLFALSSGLALGLWGKAGVEPPPTASGGGCELGFEVEGREAVDAAHAEWRAKGAAIALPPTELDFGRSFVDLDPDGHRLRVYALAGKARARRPAIPLAGEHGPAVKAAAVVRPTGRHRHRVAGAFFAGARGHAARSSRRRGVYPRRSRR